MAHDIYNFFNSQVIIMNKNQLSKKTAIFTVLLVLFAMVHILKVPTENNTDPNIKKAGFYSFINFHSNSKSYKIPTDKNGYYKFTKSNFPRYFTGGVNSCQSANTSSDITLKQLKKDGSYFQNIDATENLKGSWHKKTNHIIIKASYNVNKWNYSSLCEQSYSKRKTQECMKTAEQQIKYNGQAAISRIMKLYLIGNKLYFDYTDCFASNKKCFSKFRQQSFGKLKSIDICD